MFAYEQFGELITKLEEVSSARFIQLSWKFQSENNWKLHLLDNLQENKELSVKIMDSFVQNCD